MVLAFGLSEENNKGVGKVAGLHEIRPVDNFVLQR